MKQLILFMLLPLGAYCQENIGRTKGEIVYQSIDCITEFSNAWMLTINCDGVYSIYHFTGSFDNTQNNICSSEAIEIDSSKIMLLKNKLISIYGLSDIEVWTAKMPCPLYDSAPNLMVETDFIDTPNFTYEIRKCSATGRIGVGIFTLSIYKTLNHKKRN